MVSMPRLRPVYIKKPEEQPTLTCPFCNRRLTGKKTGMSGNTLHRKDYLVPTIEMRYECTECNVVHIIPVAMQKVEPKVETWGVHYVTDDFELRPLK